MLGPLPRMYRIIVAVAALLVFAVAGGWATLVLPYSVLVSVGASVGLAVGAACAYLLLHTDASAGGLDDRPPRRDPRRH